MQKRQSIFLKTGDLTDWLKEKELYGLIPGTVQEHSSELIGN